MLEPTVTTHGPGPAASGRSEPAPNLQGITSQHDPSTGELHQALGPGQSVISLDQSVASGSRIEPIANVNLDNGGIPSQGIPKPTFLSDNTAPSVADEGKHDHNLDNFHATQTNIFWFRSWNRGKTRSGMHRIQGYRHYRLALNTVGRDLTSF